LALKSDLDQYGNTAIVSDALDSRPSHCKNHAKIIVIRQKLVETFPGFTHVVFKAFRYWLSGDERYQRAYENRPLTFADAPGGHHMAWKLFTTNANFREPISSCSSYSSQAVALNAAFELFIHPSLHKRPFLIEGPEGQQIDRDRIESWCLDHQRSHSCAAR